MKILRTLPRSGLAVLAVAALLRSPAVPAQQTGSINLSGHVAVNCTVGVAASSAAGDLPFNLGENNPQIGTVTQNCNKKAGYKLTVSSQNCAGGTAGAKLLGTAGPGQENQRYTVEFANPTTGGSSASVTGLLDTVCTGSPGDAQITGRAVSSAKISNEQSQVYVRYTIPADLAADTYTDVLTITMTVN